MSTILLNGSIKEDFKRTYGKESTQRLVSWIFSTVSEFEDKFGKDLFDFNLKELEEYFKKSKKLSNNTLKTYLSYISKYIDFVQKNYPHKCRRSYNIIKEELDIDDFVNKVVKEKEKFIHVDEFKDIISDSNNGYVKRSLLNYTDKLLVYLLFYGVSGEEFNELRNLTYDDIDWEKNTLYLQDNGYHRKLVIGSEGIKLFELAKKETFLYSYVESDYFNEEKTTNLEESKYVFKRSTSGVVSKDEGSRINKNTITKRLTAFGNYVGVRMTPSLLLKSGKLYSTKRMVELDNGLDFNFKNFQRVIASRYHPTMTERSAYNQFASVKKDIVELYPEVADRI